MSSGCDNCAEFVRGHRCGSDQKIPWDQVVVGGDWNGEVRFIERLLSLPFNVERRGCGRVVFCWVNQMGDLFHPSVTDEQRHRIFGVMSRLPNHKFVITTRYVQAMVDWLAAPGREQLVQAASTEWEGRQYNPFSTEWPLPNVYVGASISTQAEADADVPALLTAQAAKKLVWVAPVLGAIDLSAWDSIDWLVVRAEEGESRRAPTPSWVVDLKDWAVAQEIPFHFRGWGEDITTDTEETLLDAARGDLDADRLRKPRDARRMIGGQVWDQVPA